MKLRNRIASIAISSLLVPTIVPNNNCMFYNICSATEIDDLIKELREYLIASEQQCLNNCPDIPLDYMYDKKDYPYTIHKDNIDRVLLQILKTILQNSQKITQSLPFLCSVLDIHLLKF